MIKFCVPLLVYLFIYFVRTGKSFNHESLPKLQLHSTGDILISDIFDNTDEMGRQGGCVHLEILATLVAPNYGHTWELYVQVAFHLIVISLKT